MHRNRIVRTSAREKYEIGKKVEAEMTQDERGYWRYKPGWSDEAVASYVGTKLSSDKPLSKAHVINIRRQVCGIMKPRTIPAVKPLAPKDRLTP